MVCAMLTADGENYNLCALLSSYPFRFTHTAKLAVRVLGAMVVVVGVHRHRGGGARVRTEQARNCHPQSLDPPWAAQLLPLALLVTGAAVGFRRP